MPGELTFAFTQTIASQMAKRCVFTQIEKLRMALCQLLRNLRYVLKCEYFFEFTKKNVIHAHGYVTCQASEYEINKILYSECAKRIGFCCIKDINPQSFKENFERWYDYITKDIFETKQKLTAVAEMKQRSVPAIRVLYDFRKKVSELEQIFLKSKPTPMTEQEVINDLEDKIQDMQREEAYMENTDSSFRRKYALEQLLPVYNGNYDGH